MSDALAIGSGSGSAQLRALLIRGTGERDVFFWRASTGGCRLDVLHRVLERRDGAAGAGTLRLGPSAVARRAGCRARLLERAPTASSTRCRMLGGVWSIARRMNSGDDRVSASRRRSPGRHVGRVLDGQRQQLWRMRTRQRPAQRAQSAIPGSGTLASAPAAILDANDVEDVFWRGTDGELWELSRPDDRHDAISHRALWTDGVGALRRRSPRKSRPGRVLEGDGWRPAGGRCGPRATMARLQATSPVTPSSVHVLSRP